MSQSNIDNLKKQYENISEAAAKAEFTLSQKLQGAIDEINTWNNYGGSSSNNDNDNGNYDNDDNDD